MALSFWGWQGDQRDTASFLKPNVQDKNVMPYEMAEFIEQETDLNVVVRVGGGIDLMKAFIASGYPVLLEKSYDVANNDLGWMGHYQVLFAYDEQLERFIGQDSYVGPNQPVPYESLIAEWRGFNYTFLVPYPPENKAAIMELLGPHAEEVLNINLAAQLASDEIFSTVGRDRFFAWFNRGTNLMLLQDYGGAAAAYDEAFALRASLNLPRNSDPWRIMWYQTGPYWAYFYTGRYWDVLNLATITLDEENPKNPQLEESRYWRGMAKEALGDIAGAIEDFQISVEYHPDFEPSIFALQRLGVTP
jgi:tetratricopeptide (TPR) repeat protein